MNDNPHSYGAGEVLRVLDPFRPSTRSEVRAAVRALLLSLGSTASTEGMDNGDMALIVMAAFLKEYGGVLHSLANANRELHQ